jgi:hypothetical protein
MTSSETPGTKDLLPKLIVHGGRTFSVQKQTVDFSDLQEKNYVLQFFWRSVFRSLWSEVTRPQLMLGTDWETAIYENLFRCGFGEH